MRFIVLIAAAPLLLTACGLGGAGNGSTTAAANSSAPGAIPDTVEVNGVTYVRADKAAPVPAPSPTTGASSLFGSSGSGSSPSSTSDSGSSVPPNTDASSAVSADHGE